MTVSLSKYIYQYIDIYIYIYIPRRAERDTNSLPRTLCKIKSTNIQYI